MKYKILAQIAVALMRARWKQTFVAAIGVSFSIAMFISLLGFMTGLNTLLDGIMLNRTAHVRIFNDVKPNPVQPLHLVSEYKNTHIFFHSLQANARRSEIYNIGPILQAIRKDSRVKGIACKISAPAIFQAGNLNMTGIINGIEALEESRYFSFGDYIRQGNAEVLENTNNSIMLGSGLASRLGVEPGEITQVTSANGDLLPLKIVGIVHTGIADIDKTQGYASMKTVQKLLGKSNLYVTDIQVKLRNMELAPAVAKEYASLFETDAEDIQTANAQFETGSFVRSLISYAVGITLLIVAGFGIYNILNMMIYEKMDTIAILKAIGFSGKDVKMIFIGIALCIGVIGGILGLISGYLISVLIDQIPFETAALPTVKTYPIDYNPIFYLIGISFALLTTYLAGYMPSRKASRVDPVVIIRGK
jgi:lipoprotein-releasing system permease protein